MLPDDLSIEPYAIVFPPRGDWAFRLAVNTGLAKIFRDGRTAQQIFEKVIFRSAARPVAWLGLRLRQARRLNVPSATFVR